MRTRRRSENGKEQRIPSRNLIAKLSNPLLPSTLPQLQILFQDGRIRSVTLEFYFPPLYNLSIGQRLHRPQLRQTRMLTESPDLPLLPPLHKLPPSVSYTLPIPRSVPNPAPVPPIPNTIPIDRTHIRTSVASQTQWPLRFTQTSCLRLIQFL